MDKEKKGPAWRLFEVFIFFFLVIVFIALMTKYYFHVESVSIGRYVDPDQRALDLEAQSIVVPPQTKNAENVFVLNYHIVSTWRPGDDYEISYDQFKNTMFALKREGYQTITLDQFYRFMQGELELPDKSFLLTFDDGARLAYYNADPVLKALNYTAVMFVITGFSFGGKSVYYLNETELQEAQDTGRWELESHTHLTHIRSQINSNGEVGPALTNKLWLSNESRLESDEEYYNRVSSDLSRAKDILEISFNKTITGFALPFGDFGERGKGSNYDLAHVILYKLTTDLFKEVFYQFSPTKDNEYRANYPDKLQSSYVAVRLSADVLRTPEDLLEEIEASRAIDLPYTENYENDQRWPRISGDATFVNNSIIFEKKENDTGYIVMSYLDGSYLWRDYTYSALVRTVGHESVFLIARFKNYNNYVACRYGDGYVKILSVNDLGQSYSGEAYLNADSSVQINRLAINVVGTTVSCFLDGNKVVSADISNIPAYGGIGIRAEGFHSPEEIMAFQEILVTGT